MVAGLFRRGVLVAGTLTNSKVVRIEPALNIPDRLIGEVLSALEDTLKEVDESHARHPEGRGLLMRIAVLGAAGAMAQVVLRDLLEFVPAVEITAADRKPVAASRSARPGGDVSTPRDEAGDGAAPRGPRRGPELRHLLLQRADHAGGPRGAGPLLPTSAGCTTARSSSSRCTRTS